MPRIDDCLVIGCVEKRIYCKGMCKPHYNKDYKTKHANRIKKQRHEYHENNKTRLNQESKIWKMNNPDKVKIYKANEYKKHKNKYSISAKKRYQNNKSEYKIRAANWAKNNPNRRLNIMKTHLKKYGTIFNLSEKSYKWALESWSKSIKKRDEKCVCCGKSEDCHAHHLLYKQYMPELSLNVNNGVLLCSDHHKELHYAKN